MVNGVPDAELQSQLFGVSLDESLRSWVLELQRPPTKETADHAELEIAALCVVAPSIDDAGDLVLTLGPWIVAQTTDLPTPWWGTSVSIRREAVAEHLSAPVTLPMQDASEQSAIRPRVVGVIPPEVLATVHGAAVETLMEAGVPSARVRAIPELPPLYLGVASALDIVAGFEARDAVQASHRTAGEIAEADAIVEDMRAILKALPAPTLLRLLDERVKRGSEERGTLCAHPTWPNEAWELIGVVRSGDARRARVVQEFAQLTARLTMELKLSPTTAAELEDCLGVVAMKLPTGFEWTGSFERSLREHLRAVLDSTGEFTTSLDPRYAALTGPMDKSDQYDGGVARATRAAWEVYGFAWRADNALLPSETKIRDQQRSRVIAEFDAMLHERAIAPERANALHAELAYALYDPWRPWSVFPFGAQDFQADVLPGVREELGNTLSGTSDMPEFQNTDIRQALDVALAWRANLRARARNQPFHGYGVSYGNAVFIGRKVLRAP